MSVTKRNRIRHITCLMLIIVCTMQLIEPERINAQSIATVKNPVQNGEENVSNLDEAKQSEVKEVFDHAVATIIGDNKAVGAEAVLVSNGSADFMKGYGYSDNKSGTSVDPKLTGFRIGSISKTFVAIAAMLAVQEGRLELNTDISKYLEKDFPTFTYPVTMNQLLTHTAGFEDLITGIAVFNKEDLEPLALTVRKYKPQQINKPGEVISYSNYGIELAAYVIERVVGESFDEYCRDKIFAPLGMERTSFQETLDNVVVSKAYLPNGKEEKEPYINMYPEGAVITTAEDMTKYIHWLLSSEESILRMDLKRKLFDRNFYMADELNGIGYTWNIKSVNHIRYYEKKGETLNFYSRIVIYPSCNTGIYFSFNTYVPEEEIDTVTAQVTKVLLGEEKVTGVPPESGINISGSYVNLRSSFNTTEEVLRYIIPDRMLKITGNTREGFRLNGGKMIYLGNNAYATPIGTVKYIEKDGRVLLGTDFSQTYQKLVPWEYKPVIVITCIIFLVCSLIMVIGVFIALVRKKKQSKLILSVSFLQFCALLLLIAVLLKGIEEYAILKYNVPTHFAGWVIVITTILNFGLLIKMLNHKDKWNKGYLLHNVISLAFCLVLFILKLL